MYLYCLGCKQQQSLKTHNQQLHEKEPRLGADNTHSEKPFGRRHIFMFSAFHLGMCWAFIFGAWSSHFRTLRDFEPNQLHALSFLTMKKLI